MTDSRVVVAVDLDEVLGAMVDELCAFHNEKYGSNYTTADYISYHFADVWKCSTEEAKTRMQAFFESDNFKNMKPLNAAYQTLHGLRDNCRFFVVTSRPNSLEQQTRKWIDTHFEGIFENVLLANHYAFDNSAPLKKSDICKSIGAKVLIDDSRKYTVEAAPAVKTMILFGDYAWNRTPENETLPKNVKRAHSWRQLATLLQQLNEHGEVIPREVITITERNSPASFASTVRATLENQDKVTLTAVGSSVSIAAETIELLQRDNDVKVLGLNTGADAAAPQRDRLVRLTAELEATESLRTKLIKLANEAPLNRVRRQKDGAREN